nr:MAG TPA: hypothetical protein [Caudoviricetes sp.]
MARVKRSPTERHTLAATLRQGCCLSKLKLV